MLFIFSNTDSRERERTLFYAEEPMIRDNELDSDGNDLGDCR